MTINYDTAIMAYICFEAGYTRNGNPRRVWQVTFLDENEQQTFVYDEGYAGEPRCVSERRKQGFGLRCLNTIEQPAVTITSKAYRDRLRFAKNAGLMLPDQLANKQPLTGD
jgi:hypothetical protein